MWDSEGLDKVVKPRKPGTIRTTRAKAGAKLKSEIPVTKAIEDAVVVEETVAVATGTLPDENSGAVTKAEPTQAAEAQALGDDTTHDIDAIQSKDAPGDEASAGPDTDAVRSEESVQEADAIEDAVAPTQAPTDAEIITPAASSTWEKAEPSSERAASTDLPQAVVPVPPPPAKGGFFPLLLGGIVAAILGAAALYYSNEQGWISLGSDDTLKASVDAQGVEIDALETALQSAQAEIEALRTAGAAIGTVNERVNGLSTVVDGLSEAAITLGGGLATTNKRLAEVATQPIPEARLPEKVTNAYEAKFAEFAKALQAEQDAKLADIEKRLSVSIADMEAVQAAAMQAEQAALDAATAAKTSAALADIEMALDTGAEFGSALDALGETGAPDIPDTLAGLADGSAPTLAHLQSAFPELARAALVASTRAGAQDGSVGGMTAFFRTQLGARSLEPRDGDDPDAVLSRAEAAVSGGDLQAALGEITALPEAGQAILADWKTQTETRMGARAALAALTEQLKSN